MELKLKMPDLRVTQSIVGNYTLKELADGFALLSFIFSSMQDYLPVDNEAFRLNNDLFDSSGITTPKDKLVDFLLSYGVKYDETENKKKDGGYISTSLFISSCSDDDGIEISYAKDGFIKHMKQGDDLLTAMQKCFDGLYDAIHEIKKQKKSRKK